MNKIIFRLLSVILALSLALGSHFNADAAANVYYVSTSGNDANPGTEVLPWKTIKKVNSYTFQQGDSILFKRGDRWLLNSGGEAGSLVVTSNGVTFGGYGSGNLPVFDGSNMQDTGTMYRGMIVLDNISYITIENLDLYNAIKQQIGMGTNGGNAHHITIQNCTIRTNRTNGFMLMYIENHGAQGSTNNIIIRNNHFYDSKWNAMRITGGVTKVTISGNEIHQVLHNGIDTWPRNETNNADFEISNNNIYNYGAVNGGAIYIPNSTRFQIYDNDLHDPASGTQDTYGIKAGSVTGYNLDNIIVRNNRIWNVNTNNSNTYALWFDKCTDCIAENNTLYKNSSTLLDLNNTRFVNKNNLAYGNTRQGTSGIALLNFLGDPKFFDPTAGDFHIPSDSPACSAGENNTYIGAFPCGNVVPTLAPTNTPVVPSVTPSSAPSITPTKIITPTPVPFTATPTASPTPVLPTFTATKSPTATSTAVPFTPTATATNTAAPTVIFQPTSTPVTPVVVSNGGNSVDIRVAKGSDDVEENSSGRMSTNSSDLELIYDNNTQVVGIRFTGVKIPMGATITNAYIQFKVDEATSKTTNLTIVGEANSNASAFSNTFRNVSKRTRTSNSVSWSPQSWLKVGEMGISQRTPNLSPIVQEIVNQSNWISGNSIVMIIVGNNNGKRVAKSFEGNSAGAPLLHVEFSMPVQAQAAMALPSTPTPTPTATLLTPLASPTFMPTFTSEPTQILASPTTAATEMIIPTETPTPTPIPPTPTLEVVTPTETPTSLTSDLTVSTFKVETVNKAGVANGYPVITSNGNLSVPENTMIVATITAVDTDLPAQPLIYSISGGSDSALFGINSSTGELTFVAAPDFEIPLDVGIDNIYNVTVQVSDGVSAITQDLTIAIAAMMDNTPSITSNGSLSVAENITAVTAITATDADLPADILTYSIAGGADSALFAINSSTGELTFVSVPDFESPTDSDMDNVYNVTVQVSDGVFVATQDVIVTVTSVDDNSPVVTSNGSFSVAENTAVVAAITATDADLPAESLTYSIAGGVDSALFNINPSTGELTFISTPDFEIPTDVGMDNAYNITIQASGGILTAIQDVVITVTAVNDNSPAITSNGSLSVAENTTAVTTVTAVDVDLPSQSLTYSVAGGADSALFSINSSTGELTFVAAPDFEIPKDIGLNNIYNVTVQASDGSLAVTQDISVAVTAVNDNNPVITSNGDLAIVENDTTSVIAVIATDADLPVQTLTCSIAEGADSALFRVDSANGKLTFITAPDFEDPKDVGLDNVYSITIQVTDGVLVVKQDIVITVKGASQLQ